MNSVTLIAAIVKIVIIVGFVVNLAAILSWMERRQSAMIQDRFGPNRAEIKVFGIRLRIAGLLHPVADAIKMFFKEDFIPPNADRLLHSLAPVLSLFPPLVVLAVVPFSDTLCWDSVRGAPLSTAVSRFGMCAPAGPHAVPAIPMQVADFNGGILYVFALAGMGIVGATIAGWASDNKFSLLGGLRAASQLVSYEVAMGLSLIGCIMTYGSLRPDEMVRWQGEHVWGIFAQPLAFILFFTAATAETKRAPFDLPEGESEIVAGYLLEYSGMKFGMFYMGEFIEVATSSAILVAIFLGGYNLPFLHRDGITLSLGADVLWAHALPHLAIIALQALTFFTKVVLVCWLQIFVRWSLPRFRYDQLMKLGWRMLLPAALGNIFITGVVLLSIDRASAAFADGLEVLGDLLNFVVLLSIILAFVALVWGFFRKPLRNPRTRVLPEGRVRAAAT
ncbi:MAG: NADH-quinone oxidoreductase subunit NuoH [Polyangiales bacterium]